MACMLAIKQTRVALQEGLWFFENEAMPSDQVGNPQLTVPRVTRHMPLSPAHVLKPTHSPPVIHDQS